MFFYTLSKLIMVVVRRFCRKEADEVRDQNYTHNYSHYISLKGHL